MTTAPAIADPFFAEHHEGVPDEQVARWRRRFLFLVIAGVAVWAIVTFVVGPPVIRSGYANTSPIAAVNRAFDHRAAYPIDFYLRKWNELALAGLAGWLGLGGLALFTTSRTFARRVIGTARPGTLGAIRVVTCLVCAGAALQEPVTSVVLLSPADRTPMGVMDFLYRLPIGFDSLVRSPAALTALKAITVALLLLGAIGFKTRPVLLLAAACYLPLLGIVRSYSWLSHSGLVPFYALVVLACTRSGDGWSLDRLIAQWRDRPVAPADVPAAHYAWARYAVWVVIVMQYVAAGLSKLFNDDWRWWQGLNLQHILYRDALRPGRPPDDLILQLTWLPTWAFTLMGIMTIVIELGMVLVLVSLAARLLWPIMAALMHVGIQLFQHILFWDLIVMQVVFYDWAKVRHWLGHRITARRGALDVLYDGRCSICRRSVRLLKGWDLLDRLNYLDFRALDVAAYNAHRNVTLDPAALETAMHVVGRGRVTSGFEGCRTIATVLPLFWPVVPLLYLPGLSHAGAAGYRWLARNRMAFHTCGPDGACALPGVAADPRRETTVPTNLSLARKLLGPFFVTSLVSLLLGVWVFRLEWYPFTSVQMFSTYDNSGVVTYYKCFATDAFGNRYEAPLEKMGRGVSRYRPILSGAFYNDAGRKKCMEMLQFCGTTHNAAKPRNPVVKLEVEQRQWDFVNDRNNPQRGDVTDRLAVTFAAPHTRVR